MIDIGLSLTNRIAGGAMYKAVTSFTRSMFASINSRDGFLTDVILYGLSTQAGTPTPDVPVPIVSTTGDVIVTSRAKNFINNVMANGTQNGVTFTLNPDKSVTMVGTATADFTRSLFTGLTLPAATTLTVSGAPNGSLSTYFVEYVVNKNGSSNFPKSAGGIGVFTTGLNTDTAVLGYVKIFSGTVLNVTIYPQLEIGSAATTYEAGQASPQTLPLGTTQLRSLPNGVSDRIYKDGSTWKLEQNVGEKTFTGAAGENWINLALNPNTMRVDTDSVTGHGGTTAGNTNFMTNRFPYLWGDASDTEHVRNASTVFPTTMIVYINKSRLASLDYTGVRAWLAANPLSTTFQLTTPVTTTITDPTLITALENIRTYQGVTNITASTPVSGSYLVI